MLTNLRSSRPVSIVNACRPFRAPLSLVLIGGLLICGLPAVYFIKEGATKTQTIILERKKKIIRSNLESAQAALEAYWRPPTNVLRVVADMAGRDYDLFRNGEDDEILRTILWSSNQYDVIYVVFEDGSQNVVSRIDEKRRQAAIRNGRHKIPLDAKYQHYWEDAVGSNRSRRRYTQYLDKFMSPLGNLVVEEMRGDDPRGQSPYGKAKRDLAMTMINRQNNETLANTITISQPIQAKNHFNGIIAINIDLDVFKSFLENLVRDQPKSSIHLFDDQDQVVTSASAHDAPPITQTSLNEVIKEPEYVNSIKNQTVDPQRKKKDTDICIPEERNKSSAVFQIQNPTKKTYAGLPMPFWRSSENWIIGKSCHFNIGTKDIWTLMTQVPERAVLEEIQKNTDNELRLQIVVIVCMLILISIFSYQVTRDIERVSSSFSKVGQLQLDPPAPLGFSRLLEVATLQHGLVLLVESLRAFARFVPDDLVRRIAFSGEGLTESVAETEITIFFCDIAGFTSIAECTPPDEILGHLTNYFNLVTHLVNEEQGTVDKFIGDAVMAFWGAPEDVPDHALRAARTALKIQQTLRDHFSANANSSVPQLKVRIGLHTATVLVGTIGSTDRLSYTAIGDGVNIASRLEGLNKDLGTEICISDAVCQACQGQLVTRPLGSQHLRGRGTDLTVHELLGLVNNTDPGASSAPSRR